MLQISYYALVTTKKGRKEGKEGGKGRKERKKKKGRRGDERKEGKKRKTKGKEILAFNNPFKLSIYTNISW